MPPTEMEKLPAHWPMRMLKTSGFRSPSENLFRKWPNSSNLLLLEAPSLGCRTPALTCHFGRGATTVKKGCWQHKEKPEGRMSFLAFLLVISSCQLCLSLFFSEIGPSIMVDKVAMNRVGYEWLANFHFAEITWSIESLCLSGASTRRYL